MSLSKSRDRIRKRVESAKKRGISLQLSPTDEFAALPKYKRIERLAELALHKVEQPISAAHCIAAIKEVNLMEHVYDLAPRVIIPQVLVFIRPDGTKMTFQEKAVLELPEGEQVDS